VKTALIKIVLIAGLGVTLRAYLARARSVLRDRLLGVGLFTGLLGAVLYPQATTWVANRLGVGRGTDLVFYLAIVVILFLVVVVNGRRQVQEQALTDLAREIALLRWEVETLKRSTPPAEPANRVGPPQVPPPASAAGPATPSSL